MSLAILFDLDGTLVDSIELILGSARYAFVGFDGEIPTDEEWRAGIGRPLLTVLRERAHGDEAEAQRLLARYREYQMEHHDRMVRAYDGLIPILREFSAIGHRLAVVTSKSDWLALKALELVGIADLFPVLVGCDSCTNHKPHPEPVERALALLGAAPADAIFVGDSPHDVESGRAAGVFTVGVTWGAFTREQMQASGADLIIDEVDQLPAAVAQKERPGIQTF